MAANIKSVHLVIGPRTRVVSVQVNGGRVNRKIIRKLMKNGEQLLGVIGHHRGTLSPEGALKILEARVEALDVSRSRSADLKLDLLFDPNSNMVAMRGEVTIGQMRQFVKETRYVATGYNADEFKRLIEEGKASDPMEYTNKTDCLAFIRWALIKVQAQDPRIKTLGLPSDEEWESMQEIFNQLTGKFWERLSDNYFLSFNHGARDYCHPWVRSPLQAFRLIGTYKES